MGAAAVSRNDRAHNIGGINWKLFRAYFHNMLSIIAFSTALLTLRVYRWGALYPWIWLSPSPLDLCWPRCGPTCALWKQLELCSGHLHCCFFLSLQRLHECVCLQLLQAPEWFFGRKKNIIGSDILMSYKVYSFPGLGLRGAKTTDFIIHCCSCGGGGQIPVDYKVPFVLSM